jgi:hypothetical protein
MNHTNSQASRTNEHPRKNLQKLGIENSTVAPPATPPGPPRPCKVLRPSAPRGHRIQGNPSRNGGGPAHHMVTEIGKFFKIFQNPQKILPKDLTLNNSRQAGDHIYARKNFFKILMKI